jgi:hypothetical protein
MTSVGPAVQSLIAVTTSQRFKKLGETLSDIVNSFKVYKLSSGIFAGAGETKKEEVKADAPTN